MNTFEVVSSLDAGKQIADRLSDTTESARTLYSVLLALAFDYVEHKQYPVIPSFVTFHSSLTLIAAVAGVSRWTAWRGLARLKALGLVDFRAQKGKLFDKIRHTGSVYQVRLNPCAGSAAKLSFQDVNHKYKDLNLLARSRRLSHQTLHHIEEIPAIEVKYQVLKEWTLKTYTHKTPVVDYMVQGGLEAILAVSSAQGREVAEAVDRAAVALSQALADTKSTDYYRKLMWALKRRYSATGEDLYHTVYLQADRIVKADRVEWPGLRSPGALLLSRLAKYDWYGEVFLT